MLLARHPIPVKFFCAFLYSDNARQQKALNTLSRRYGTFDYVSTPIPFTFTEYYTPEMGPRLYRQFVSFTKLRKQDHFARIKEWCVSLEKKLSIKNKRTVNIDPGYIGESKVVLTTTKDFSHRIYIGKKMFAEITLLYARKQKTYTDLPWTFPDYRTDAYKSILLAIRTLYTSQLAKRAHV